MLKKHLLQAVEAWNYFNICKKSDENAFKIILIMSNGLFFSIESINNPFRYPFRITE